MRCRCIATVSALIRIVPRRWSRNIPRHIVLPVVRRYALRIVHNRLASQYLRMRFCIHRRIACQQTALPTRNRLQWSQTIAVESHCTSSDIVCTALYHKSVTQMRWELMHCTAANRKNRVRSMRWLARPYRESVATR